ncbi:MAG: HIT family protein [Actinomycetota bacterium]|nr:HIT family protein [Actinomycetota bacterium]
MTNDRCIFCQIVEGQAPATRVYEDDTTLALMDIFPVAKGHCLVIPKQHHSDLLSAPVSVVTAVITTAHHIAPALVKTVEADGLNLLQSNGRAAWQTVDHFHIHLIPRWHSDGLRPPGTPAPADRDELQTIAEQIAREL